jgi:hypothetical protein
MSEPNIVARHDRHGRTRVLVTIHSLSSVDPNDAPVAFSMAVSRSATSRGANAPVPPYVHEPGLGRDIRVAPLLRELDAVCVCWRCTTLDPVGNLRPVIAQPASEFCE